MLRGAESPAASLSGGSSSGNVSSGPRRGDSARSAELKNRRRVTKALAAKRSRAQHGHYVSALSEESEELRDRIKQLRLQRDVNAVAHQMITELSDAVSPERCNGARQVAAV